MGLRVAEQYVLFLLQILYSYEQIEFLSYGTRGVMQQDYQLYLYRHANAVCDDATRSYLITLFHTFRSTVRTVQELTPVVLSNQSFDAFCDYYDGLIGISIEVIVNDGFSIEQIAA